MAKGKREKRLLKLRAKLARKPIIAGLKGVGEMGRAAQLGVEVCFYLSGNSLELKKLAARCQKQGQMLFVHVDLIEGVAKDAYGMRALAMEIGVDGILTTKGYLILAAQKAGLLGIQRLFMLDSEALRTGLRMLTANQPDAVEILPALIAPYIRNRLPQRLPLTIAGGLVEEESEVRQILHPPIAAISTSKVALWAYGGA